MGGIPLENIICLNNRIRHYDQKILTKTIVALGGTLENKIQYDQGIHCRNHGILTNAILACGGGSLENKFDLNREYAVVTMKFSPRLFSRVGENFEK